MGGTILIAAVKYVCVLEGGRRGECGWSVCGCDCVGGWVSGCDCVGGCGCDCVGEEGIVWVVQS